VFPFREGEFSFVYGKNVAFYVLEKRKDCPSVGEKLDLVYFGYESFLFRRET